MQVKSSVFLYFFIFLLISVFLIFISKFSFFKPVNSIVSSVFAPISAVSYSVFSDIRDNFYSSKVKSLQEENLALSKKLIDQNKLIRDNKALRDQFATSYPISHNLLAADIVGAPSLIPGISVAENLVLDKGLRDGVRVGDAVVYKDNLLGKVVSVSDHISSVNLINNPSTSFTAKTLTTNALGIVKGQGGEDIIMDEILQSDSLKKDDLVLTKGDINKEGIGIPPDLIVGKIVSISKNPSDLFQKAKIKSNVDLSKLDKVFIIINP
jgi:rod shape-determining protein MreC